jgi:hypothetical protein
MTSIYKQITAKSSEIIGYTPNHSILLIMGRELMRYDIHNWQFNRPPDTARLPEIEKCIKNNGRVDGIIGLVVLSSRIYIWDGCHRYLCVKRILDNNADLDFPIMIEIINNDSDLAKQRYIECNKCIAVPEIYRDLALPSQVSSAINDVIAFTKLVWKNDDTGKTVYKSATGYKTTHIPYMIEQHFVNDLKVAYIILKDEYSNANLIICKQKLSIALDKFNNFIKSVLPNPAQIYDERGIIQHYNSLDIDDYLMVFNGEGKDKSYYFDRHMGINNNYKKVLKYGECYLFCVRGERVRYNSDYHFIDMYWVNLFVKFIKSRELSIFM